MAKAKGTPEKKILLRWAKAEDVVNIFKLVRRQQESVSPVAEPATQENNHWVISHLLEVIVTGKVIVADLSGRLVGVLGCRQLPDEAGKSVFGLDTYAFLSEFEGVGVEKALMSKLCTFMEKAGHILKFAINADAPLASEQESLAKSVGLSPVCTVWQRKTEEPEVEQPEPQSEPESADPIEDAEFSEGEAARWESQDS